MLHARTRLLAIALCATATVALAQEIATPNEHLAVTGVPPVPVALMQALAPYTEFRPRSVASWHPVRRELVVATRARNTTQLHRVSAPGAPLEPITDFAEPVRHGAWLDAKPDTLLFVRDTGGNERTQIRRHDASILSERAL